MREYLLSILVVVGCASGASPRPAPAPASSPTPIVAVTAVEEALPSPKTEPTPIDPSTLWQFREALRKARAHQIERLRAYRKAKQFPHYVVSGVFRFPHHRTIDAAGADAGPFRGGPDDNRSPVFIDERDVHCAVGYLMRESGWGTEAREIAAADNHVLVERVTSGPLVDWIVRSGLTQDEAAYIQPAYDKYLREQEKRAAKVLDQHFRNVERSLVENTEISLDIAMVRLEPAIRAGLTIAEIGPRRATK
jgi:hypothetical protein